jgi:N-acetylglucosaminyldiphosphoundecaprenol N-acetyl-beta-D-mannosaminyltransferase
MAIATPAPPRRRETAAANAAPRISTVDIAGVPISDGDLAGTVAFCTARREAGLGTRVATANLDFLALARKDAGLRRLLGSATMVVADGAPVAWLARAAGGRHAARVAGVDLVGALCAAGDPEEPLRVLIYGSSPAIAGPAAAELARRSAGIVVVDVICPPFRPLTSAEAAADRERIAAAAPGLVLVALGFPAQEQLAAEWFDAAPTATWVGIGGTLDFYAGHRRRAPRWMQRTGTEWLARLAQEPRRLWRRYLLRDLPALVAIAPGVVTARLRQGHRSTRAD